VALLGVTVSPFPSKSIPLLPAGGREAALATLQAEIASCAACALAGRIPEARPIHRGKGRIGDRIMVVGQAPGVTGHEHPRPFSGAAGRTLRGWLTAAGFDAGALHDRCYLTSITRCFPGSSGASKGDRMPTAAEVTRCRPFLDRELALVRPELVLALGRLAVTELLGPAPLAAVVGTVREVERADHRFVVLPFSHPSGISRWLNDPANRAHHDRAIALLAGQRQRHGY